MAYLSGATTLNHSLFDKFNRSSKDCNSSYLDDSFLNRVRDSYIMAGSKEASSQDSVWLSIGALQADVHDALLQTENSKLRNIFREPAITNIYYGVDNLARHILETLSLRGDLDQVKEDSRRQVVNAIYRLSEALGVRRWLPLDGEQISNYYPAGHEVTPDVESLLAKLSTNLGFEIDFPNPFSGELGMNSSRGFITYRALQAIYQAYLIVHELGSPNGKVVEIGPGMGRTAYYARRAGVSDYTTIDLPIGVVGQACFLGAALGPDTLWLLGDDPSLAKGRISLLPSTLPFPEQERFALALNVDSMVEMGLEASANYAKWIARQANIFLSINHESGGPTIADLGHQFFSKAKSRRTIYWMRHGYVEETFHF